MFCMSSGDRATRVYTGRTFFGLRIFFFSFFLFVLFCQRMVLSPLLSLCLYGLAVMALSRGVECCGNTSACVSLLFTPTVARILLAIRTLFPRLHRSRDSRLAKYHYPWTSAGKELGRQNLGWIKSVWAVAPTYIRSLTMFLLPHLYHSSRHVHGDISSHICSFVHF